MKVVPNQSDYSIIDKDGVEQPAWKHEDGTIVSFWDMLPKLTIKDEYGTREILHEEAKELGYIN
jgi:hypothetical protein